MFYKPKHMKRNPNSFINRSKRAVKFVCDEATWYMEWWGNAIYSFPSRTAARLRQIYQLTMKVMVCLIDGWDRAIDF